MLDQQLAPPFVLYAPNLNVGGGLVLLKALLNAWPVGWTGKAFFDIRAKHQLTVPAGVEAHWVKPTIWSRLEAELLLRKVGQSSQSVLCFHGLPPLFRNTAQVYVYLQNRLHLVFDSAIRYPLKIRARLWVETRILKHRAKTASGFLVQTTSMAHALNGLLSAAGLREKPVFVLPFAPTFTVQESSTPYSSPAFSSVQQRPFVYVADDMPHKNHANLIQAWALLAKEGIYPQLMLTIDESTEVLYSQLNKLRSENAVRIVCTGKLSHSQVLGLYSSAAALIYPSLTESFGLPLIEATQLGLPVIAGELDYVRDVCMPVETFDPYSALSIARAVKRFLACETEVTTPNTPQGFWQQIEKICN